MDVLITTPIFPPEGRGPATYTFELSKKLIEKKYRVKVITFTQNPTKIPDIPVFSVTTGGGTFTRQTKLLMKILEWGKNSDVIYAQGADVVGLASVIGGKVLHKKVVIKFVGDLSIEMERDFYRKIRYLPLVIKICLFFADEVVFPAKHLQKTICEKYKVNKSKTTIIYNAIND